MTLSPRFLNLWRLQQMIFQFPSKMKFKLRFQQNIGPSSDVFTSPTIRFPTRTQWDRPLPKCFSFHPPALPFSFHPPLFRPAGLGRKMVPRIPKKLEGPN
eukprot:TRINITY_DN54059_c0_g1_i1.p1 TRINITY_DN54059_c0_g1~~TRINITY_DN54059_c0_g1_i1.p1  ORF type:complete len:100 (+),score=6.71 TRINITY_DN54059_c0_g1_i1:161-460(+)